MSINIHPVDDGFAVTSQLSPGDFAELAQQGIRSVINNRPDGEGGTRQPSAAQLRAAAEAAGLFYAHLPVVSGQVSETDASRMRALIGELPKPILSFCRTGTRSTNLYHAACRNTQAVSPGLNEGSSVKANVGGVDRALRVLAGLGLIGATLSGAIGAWGWLGVLPLATGLFRFCPAYLPFGLRTCRVAD